MKDLWKLGRVSTSALAVLVAAGCGGDGGGDAGEAGEAGGEAAQMESPVDPATAGSITGTVMFSGTAPEPEPIDMAEEQTCAEQYDGQPTRPVAVVGDGGGFGQVFVYVKSGLPADMRFPTGTGEAVLDQEGCQYHPHVLGVTTGQEITVRNSDDVLHNVNATPDENRGFNRSQPRSGMEFQTSFASPEIMIPVRCDVHGWMEAYIGVTDHPYFAVTGEDGSFDLSDLPPGEYEIEAWHDRYGTQTQTVTVPESGQAEVSFTFDQSMAGNPAPMGPALVHDHETGGFKRAPAVASQP